MNREEIKDFYQIYSRYYIGGKYSVFEAVFIDEFGDVPFYLMRAALNKWTSTSKGAFPPKVMELKEILWRIKLIAQGKLFDSNYNEEWNAIHYGTSKFSPADLISETEDEKWVKYDKVRPVLSAEEKSQLASIVAELNRGLRGFNSQYE